MTQLLMEQYGIRNTECCTRTTVYIGMRIGANRLAWEFGGRVFMGSEVGVGSGSCHLHEEKRNTYSTAGGTN